MNIDGSDPVLNLITPDDAAHVLYSYAEGGHPAGGFMTYLIEAMMHADPINLTRLMMVFPGPAAAVDLAKNVPGGIGILISIAAQPAPAVDH